MSLISMSFLDAKETFKIQLSIFKTSKKWRKNNLKDEFDQKTLSDNKEHYFHHVSLKIMKWVK